MNIVPVKEHLELYQKFAGEIKPQNCFVEYDPRLSRVRTMVNPELGSIIPSDYARNLIRRYNIPFPIYAESANRLMEELVPLLKIVDKNYLQVWKDNNYVGELNEDGQEAELKIEKFIDEYIDGNDAIETWDAEMWYGDCSAEDLGITSKTTDEELQKIQESTKVELEVDIIEGAEKYLKNIRDNLCEEENNGKQNSNRLF
jgi:hypothetical protein